MYGHPADPTFNKTLIRELRAQNKKCAGCRFNIQKPGDKHCKQGHWAYADGGPCILHEDIENEERQE